MHTFASNDMWFLEAARNLAWMGAEAVFCSSETYTSGRAQKMFPAQTLAIMNQLYSLNLNGLEGGGIGKSIFVDPEAHILQTLGAAEMILIEAKDLYTVSPMRQ